ncbi:hypothetical protein KVC60_01135 [Helicobacter pylori]|uniref:hypothetical protein n=1 Tax=Helicobacter pylori TaxID=210 RepID=UPI00165AEBD9|nr:hypothetical protein [Helicobacter pylori]WQS13205.1 hypothetical protein KVC03_01290 [Helicobacter pylori]WQS20952.1 hypothetical protein KVC60_01135 [Helicobacter pylori]WQS30293.1 hypothetical protein KVE56_01135 [Helicobacter pylori]
MIKTYFKGLNSPKQRAAAARLAKDIATNGIEDVERRARNYPKLEHRAGELEAENGVLKAENEEFRERLKNDFDEFKRDVEELVRREVENRVSKNSADTQTQKYIYFPNDDSQGSLVKFTKF